ncbi:hypothetical protein [Vibrio sp. WXL103]|uniref:hypothetical protein n=1 Tax=Vibrio sp. WXL103 TaxID=3450710 RepID=UPI003EC5CCE5
MKVMRKTKYDKYRLICERLSGDLKNVPEDSIKEILASWELSFAQLDVELSNPETTIKKSLVTAGIEQGLIDTYYVILELPDESRYEAKKYFVEACSDFEPTFLERITDRSGKILKRGKIRNESEWYIVRSKVDDLMLQRNEKEALEYQKLLDDFDLG